MEERTKRGGWKARDEDSGVCGPIQNSQDVPTSHLAGDVVEVTVVYANEREAAFKWKH
jgi:CRISPR-associated protein Cmr6